MNIKIIFKLIKEAFQEYQADKVSTLAASLAYYTVFSLAPLLIIAIAVAGLIFGEQAARGEIVGQIQGLVGNEGAKVIEMAIENANKPDVSGIASIFSIIVLLFGASGVFVQLQDALNSVWEVTAKPKQGIMGFVRKRILSFSAVLGIGFLLLVSLIISAALSALNHYMNGLIPGLEIFWEILNFAISFGIVTLLFALIYKFLPDVKIHWSDVWTGAIITSLLFGIGKFVLGVYLGRGSLGSTYGAAGSLVVLLAWVYYSAQILLFGAELTEVYSRRFGSQIVPDKHAMFLPEERRRKRRKGKDKRRYEA
ncbi:MAG: YihY/virulence factor BrkB family protein [Calothrix sp. MO_167.B42]|nr:YihY/virulence factor BrkB family protein [Calothrix sp. MO_167.B42]